MIVDTDDLPVGNRLVCSGCGKTFWKKDRPKGRRMFCSIECRDTHPFKRQPPEELRRWAEIDMALGLTWYQSAKKRRVARTSMRNQFVRLGYKPKQRQSKKGDPPMSPNQGWWKPYSTTKG